MEERLAANRARILRATRTLISRGGLREARIGAVAEQAGLSTGALYRYFPSKADLFVHVLTAAVDHEIEILEEIAKGPGSAQERLGGAVESFVRRALRGPKLAYAFIAEPTEPAVDTARIECRMRFGEVFKHILRSGVDAGEFPDQDIDTSAACIVGAFTESLVGPIASSAGGTAKTQRLVREVKLFCLTAVSGPRA
jgi:AcrR family transcriptional regulator